MGGLCPRCRGRGWCGRDECVYLAALREVRERLSRHRDLDGYTLTVHVSWRGYPRVRLAPGVGERDIPDEGRALARLPYDELLELRALTFRKRSERRHVRETPDLSHEEIEATVSARPVESTLHVERRLSDPTRTAPFLGPLVDGRLELDGTPRVPSHLERVHEDELKAERAVIELYERGFDEGYIARALSLGLLGHPADRRLVPTRWSVAAVDSIVSDYLKRTVRELPPGDDYRLLHGELFGNEMWVILRPEPLSYELIEVYEPGAPWSDRERVTVLRDAEVSREREPEETGGAYYAARVGALEACRDLGRQFGITVIRVVRREYSAPLGAWVIREAVRRAEEVMRTDDHGELLEALRERLDGPARAALRVLRRDRQSTLDRFL